MRYAEIILPYALPPLTYACGELDLCEGMAVAVPFGKRRTCPGIVWRLHDTPPRFAVREVERVLYGTPLLSAAQRDFWAWMASYYMCTPGEVMAGALPAALRPEGFSPEEFAREEYRPLTVRMVAAGPAALSEEALAAVLEKLQRRAPVQYAAMIQAAEALGEGLFTGGGVPRSALEADSVLLNKLVEKGLLTLTEEEVRPAAQGAGAPNPDPAALFDLPRLTPAQQTALDAIDAAAQSTVLLHGVSGSGKTEIFINLAARELAAGRGVLYLLPEIPLSLQLIERLGEVFGPYVAALPSKLPARRRAALFLELARGEGGPRLVVGTRSAVFMPLHNLGLIVVDEEHDGSFKQESPAPRFHARDSALMLASLHGARTVLGSATPSLESWHNAQGGKYGLVTLTERYGGVPAPRIVLSDSMRAGRRGERTSHFNKLLLDKLGATLDAGGQAILFQNRRGFSPWVECGACSWVAHCPDCNVTLTLHKAEGRLRCHYCGYATPPPTLCPSCGQGELVPHGYGTEKVEEELTRLAPGARIERLDGDTTASPAAAGRIIGRFARGETDVLVGTQLVTKGFDFGGVRLVGVVNADNLLNYPDFRASERAFQTLTQAAGRAGRRGEQGEVVIQTTQPEHPVLAQVIAGDYAAMAAGQLAERRAFFYPPYCRLVSVTLRHRDPALVDSAANALAGSLRPVFGRRVLGPEAPVVDRVQGEHIRTLLLKVERDKSFARAREILGAHLDVVRTRPEYKKVVFTVNVDPA